MPKQQFQRGLDPKEAMGTGDSVKRKFEFFADALENEELELSDQAGVDAKNLQVTFYSDWHDDDYECSTKVTLDFRTGKISQSGDCKNPSIQVPGPGYMVDWDYDQKQEENFDPNAYETIDDFNELIADYVESYNSLFSQFAQQNGENHENADYCESCGELEEDCTKCPNCGECENICDGDCEDDEDYEKADEDLDESAGKKQKKFNKVMKEMSKNKLKTSAGKKLNPKNEKDRKQGLAIAYSEAGLSKNEGIAMFVQDKVNEGIGSFVTTAGSSDPYKKILEIMRAANIPKPAAIQMFTKIIDILYDKKF